MGRPRIDVENHPLYSAVLAYASHLKSTGRTEKSAMALCYYIRRALAYLPESFGLDLMQEFIDELPHRQRSTARTALRGFARFVATPGRLPPGITVPVLPDAPTGRPATRATKRDHLLLLLYHNGARDIADLVGLRWRNVSVGIEAAKITFPGGRSLLVSRRFIDAVREAGFPYTTGPIAPSLPVFPEVPEGVEALSEWRAEAAIARGQVAVDERIFEPWEVPPNLLNLKL